jgi:predicted ArsR family transcriptional regulator
MTHYHITTPERPAALSDYELKARTQDKNILTLLEWAKKLSPGDVARSMPNIPITSIRRALTNLTRLGYAVKTDEVKKGMYGRNEHVWMYKESK